MRLIVLPSKQMSTINPTIPSGTEVYAKKGRISEHTSTLMVTTHPLVHTIQPKKLPLPTMLLPSKLVVHDQF